MRQRRSAVRYESLAKAVSAPLLTKSDRTCEMDVSTFPEIAMTVACGSMQGWRKEMEDAHFLSAVSDKPTIRCLAVFDGHRGREAAQYCSSTIGEICGGLSHTSGEDLTSLFRNMDSGLRDKSNVSNNLLQAAPTHQSNAGCTAHIVFIEEGRQYTFANVGDCRSYIISRSPTNLMHWDVGIKSRYVPFKEPAEGTPLEEMTEVSIFSMSTDHRTSNEEEVARVQSCGGFVVDGRTNGKLGVTRALGDFDLKGDRSVDPARYVVSCDPEIVVGECVVSSSEHRQQKFDPMDYHLVVVGCDGIWELQDCHRIGYRAVKAIDATIAQYSDQSVLDVSDKLLGEVNATLCKVVTESLNAACAPYTDPRGCSQGTDNLSLIIGVSFP